ncbi:MAG: glutamate racemase, partial [Myxococcota bacterium]
DAGATPYGLMPPHTLARRVRAVAEALCDLGADEVIVACNAASSILPLPQPPCPMRGVIAPGIAAALQAPGAIGVIGGVRTIASRRHEDALRAAGRVVCSRVAQPLSALVEQGHTSGPAVTAAIREILDPIAEVEVLLLACTHYPALRAAISEAYPHMVLVDPCAALAATVEAVGGPSRFLTSGDPGAMRAAAAAVWGLELGVVERAQWPISPE